MKLLNRAFLCLFLAGIAALAQFDTAVVLGTVRDASQAVVAGARITLLNIDTGIQATATTDENGNYLFNNVKIGTYKVTAEKPGFSTAFADRVKVDVNARQRVGVEEAFDDDKTLVAILLNLLVGQGMLILHINSTPPEESVLPAVPMRLVLLPSA